MQPREMHLKIEWSQEEGCYVGTCPGLMLGGVHGANEGEVYRELCKVVEEWIRIHEEDGDPLRPATAGKEYFGKFVVRVGRELHKELAIEAHRSGKSLNSYCLDLLLLERGPGYAADKSARPTRGTRRTPHRRGFRPAR